MSLTDLFQPSNTDEDDGFFEQDWGSPPSGGGAPAPSGGGSGDSGGLWDPFSGGGGAAEPGGTLTGEGEPVPYVDEWVIPSEGPFAGMTQAEARQKFENETLLSQVLGTDRSGNLIVDMVRDNIQQTVDPESTLAQLDYIAQAAETQRIPESQRDQEQLLLGIRQLELMSNVEGAKELAEALRKQALPVIPDELWLRTGLYDEEELALERATQEALNPDGLLDEGALGRVYSTPDTLLGAAAQPLLEWLDKPSQAVLNQIRAITSGDAFTQSPLDTIASSGTAAFSDAPNPYDQDGDGSLNFREAFGIDPEWGGRWVGAIDTVGVIATDPTTYMTLGGSTLRKAGLGLADELFGREIAERVAREGLQRALTPAQQQVFREALERTAQEGIEAGARIPLGVRRQLAADLTQEAYERGAAAGIAARNWDRLTAGVGNTEFIQTGLHLGRQTILPMGGLQQGLSRGIRGAGDLPVVGRPARTAADLFSPRSAYRRTAGQGAANRLYQAQGVADAAANVPLEDLMTSAQPVAFRAFRKEGGQEAVNARVTAAMSGGDPYRAVEEMAAEFPESAKFTRVLIKHFEDAGVDVRTAFGAPTPLGTQVPRVMDDIDRRWAGEDFVAENPVRRNPDAPPVDLSTPQGVYDQPSLLDDVYGAGPHTGGRRATFDDLTPDEQLNLVQRELFDTPAKLYETVEPPRPFNDSVQGSMFPQQYDNLSKSQLLVTLGEIVGRADLADPQARFLRRLLVTAPKLSTDELASVMRKVTGSASGADDILENLAPHRWSETGQGFGRMRVRSIDELTDDEFVQMVKDRLRAFPQRVGGAATEPFNDVLQPSFGDEMFGAVDQTPVIPRLLRRTLENLSPDEWEDALARYRATRPQTRTVLGADEAVPAADDYLQPSLFEPEEDLARATNILPKIPTEAGQRLLADADSEKVTKFLNRETRVQQANELAREMFDLPEGFKVFEDDPLMLTALYSRQAFRDNALLDMTEGLAKAGDLEIYGSRAELGRLRPDWTTEALPDGRIMYGPQELMDEMRRTKDIIRRDKGLEDFSQMMRKWQNTWAKYATVPLVGFAFHARNLYGNLWLNFLAGVTNPAKYAEAIQVQNLGRRVRKRMAKKALTFDEALADLGRTNSREARLLRSARREGVLTSSFFDDVNYDTVNRDVNRSWRQRNLSLEDNVITRSGFAFGSAIEDNARLAHYISKLDEVGDAKAAAASVKKYLFDYTDLTAFERNVMRSLNRFYTFMRKNLGLQLYVLANRPGMTLNALRMEQAVMGTEEDRFDGLPDWAQEAGMGRNPEGGSIASDVLSLGGLLDIDTENLALGLDSPFDSAIDVMNPLAQAIFLVPGLADTLPAELRPDGDDLFRDLIGLTSGGPVEFVKYLVEGATEQDLFTGANLEEQGKEQSLMALADTIAPLWSKTDRLVSALTGNEGWGPLGNNSPSRDDFTLQLGLMQAITGLQVLTLGESTDSSVTRSLMSQVNSFMEDLRERGLTTLDRDDLVTLGLYPDIAVGPSNPRRESYEVQEERLSTAEALGVPISDEARAAAEPPPGAPESDQAGTSEVRSWAAQNGYEVSASGRIPRDAQVAYNRAHPDRQYMDPWSDEIYTSDTRSSLTPGAVLSFPGD